MKAISTKGKWHRILSPLTSPSHPKRAYFILQDQTTAQEPAVNFFGLDRGADSEAARLAEQLINQNGDWLKGSTAS